MSFVHAFETGALGTLVLGGAQIGMAYGIANKVGKPDRRRVGEILSSAWAAGVAVIDTAQAYGDSEAAIGEHLRNHRGQRFYVTSKLSAKIDHTEPEAIVRAGRQSVSVIGQPLASLLLHDAAALRGWKHGVCDGLRRCVDEGIAETIGVSIYTPAEFQAALDLPELRVIQAPFNVLDRRLLVTGLLHQAIDAGRIVILRSVLLQGLLTLEENEVPHHLAFAAADLSAWRALCKIHGESLVGAALAYVRRVAPRALMVIGSDLPEQVAANAALVAHARASDGLVEGINALPIASERTINPVQWR